MKSKVALSFPSLSVMAYRDCKSLAGDTPALGLFPHFTVSHNFQGTADSVTLEQESGLYRELFSVCTLFLG